MRPLRTFRGYRCDRGEVPPSRRYFDGAEERPTAVQKARCDSLMIHHDVEKYDTQYHSLVLTILAVTPAQPESSEPA